MTEEHQVTAGEYITPGPPRALFNNICGGCHGSLSGSELDIAVSADALTGASVSLSRNPAPKNLAVARRRRRGRSAVPRGRRTVTAKWSAGKAPETRPVDN